MGEEDEELTGFSWRGGAERETTGVLLWNEPFISKLPSGEEVGFLLFISCFSSKWCLKFRLINSLVSINFRLNFNKM